MQNFFFTLSFVLHLKPDFSSGTQVKFCQINLIDLRITLQLAVKILLKFDSNSSLLLEYYC